MCFFCVHFSVNVGICFWAFSHLQYYCACVRAFRRGLMGITALHSNGILMGHKHDVLRLQAIKHEKALTLQLTNNSSSHVPHATMQLLTHSGKRTCTVCTNIDCIWNLHFNPYAKVHKTKSVDYHTIHWAYNLWWYSILNLFSILFVLRSVAQSAAQYTSRINMLK